MFGPPGVRLYVLVAIAVALALDANSRQSDLALFAALPIWALVAAIWLLRFLTTAWTGRLRLPLRHWLRWFAVPALLGLVFVLTRFDVPFDVRLALSRGAMDQAEAEIWAGGSTDRAWIGLYPVAKVERTLSGIRFVIDDSGLGRIGFAYTTELHPEPLPDDPAWSGATFRPLGGGWWLWWQEWD
jgi:hypothetical protein